MNALGYALVFLALFNATYGQVNNPNVVTQISDGQVQAPFPQQPPTTTRKGTKTRPAPKETVAPEEVFKPTTTSASAIDLDGYLLTIGVPPTPQPVGIAPWNTKATATLTTIITISGQRETVTVGPEDESIPLFTVTQNNGGVYACVETIYPEMKPETACIEGWTQTIVTPKSGRMTPFGEAPDTQTASQDSETQGTRTDDEEVSSNTKSDQSRPPQAEATTTKRDRTQPADDDLPFATKSRNGEDKTISDGTPLQTDSRDLPSATKTRQDRPSSADGNQQDENSVSNGNDLDTSTFASPTTDNDDTSSTVTDDTVSQSTPVVVSAGDTATNGLPSDTGAVSRPGRTTTRSPIESTGAPDIFANPSDTKTTITESGITGTYSLSTISEYGTLKGTTTVTTRYPVTQTDGSISETIIPIIIGPGGLHWTPLCNNIPCPGGGGGGGGGGVIPPCLGLLCGGGGGGGVGGGNPPSDPDDPEDPEDPDDEEDEDDEDEKTTADPQESATRTTDEPSSTPSSSSGSSCILPTTIWPLPSYTIEEASGTGSETLPSNTRSESSPSSASSPSSTSACQLPSTIWPLPSYTIEDSTKTGTADVSAPSSGFVTSTRPRASADQEPTKTTKTPPITSKRVNPPKTTSEPEDEEPEEEEPDEEETEEEEPEEPEEPPPKPKPSEAIIIYRSEFCTEFSCTASARVFEITPGEPVNPCSDRADYTESQGSIDSEDVDVGPFSAWGYEALSYH
ncbi:MAG: hypothetical protein Q9204_008134, partial [Flavoplaca sp. TL-2023a]